MLCPACKTELIVVEYNQIELDYCTTCRGVWFDATELELLLKSFSLDSPYSLVSNLLNFPEFNSAEKKRKCPICNKTMKLVNIGDNQNIIIDICYNGDGLWFDGGEVVELIRQISEKNEDRPGTRKIFNFLGEVFQI